MMALTDLEFCALSEYTSDMAPMSDPINGLLRGTIELDDSDQVLIKQYIKGIDSVFKKKELLVTWEEPIILFRGIDDTIENLDKYVGIQKAYVSTSINSEIAMLYADKKDSFILRLNINSLEVPIINMDDYTFCHLNEEYLVDRNTEIVVLNIYPVGHISNPYRRIVVDCIVK